MKLSKFIRETGLRVAGMGDVLLVLCFRAQPYRGIMTPNMLRRDLCCANCRGPMHHKLVRIDAEETHQPVFRVKEYRD